jgi:hypothetical protein
VQQRVAGAAELSRPLAVRPAQAVEQHLFQAIPVDQRQAQIRGQAFRQRGLAGAGQARDDDE